MIENTRYPEWTPIVLIALFLIILVTLFFVFQRFLLLPKILVFTLIILTAVFVGKLKPLLNDWFVFIAFVYLFDSLRGTIYLLTCRLSLPVYAFYVIKIEKFLFNNIPSVILQNRLLNSSSPEHFSWLEKFLTVIHGSHFVAFLLVGFFFWLYKPNQFRLYKTSFYLAMSLGLLCYLFFPTIPPWMSYRQFGLIPPITHFNLLLLNFVIPDICIGFDTNPIAAMPSLHAAFPILCSLLLWPLYRWKAIPFYFYTILVLFTVVYSGDHYVTDLFAGMILAIVCYYSTLIILNNKVGNQEILASEKLIVGFSDLTKPIIIGMILFILGISIGSINKRQFFFHPNNYSLNAPRYVDFFNFKEKYAADFHIQMYFGKYYSIREEYKKALPCFQQVLSLAKNSSEEQIAKQQIIFCNRMIKAQRKW